MEQIIISHKTALLFLRYYRCREDFNEIINVINNCNINVDVMVGSVNQFHKNKSFKFHLRPAIFNKNMTINFSKQVSCVCPEILICQMSSILNFEDLALLVHELCGTYSIIPNTGNFISDVNSVTSVSKISKCIENYTSSNHYFKNINVLRDVLKFAKDNSASPMESRICIKLCGPRRYGFYGCKGLDLNRNISLSKEAKIIAGQKIIISDFCNVKKKVVVEYDSAQFHENVEQGQKDKRRRDALVYDGWTVFSLVPAVANNPVAFHVVACQILEALGQGNVFTSKKYKKRRLEAFEKLK